MFNTFKSQNKIKFVDSMKNIIKKTQSGQKINQLAIEQYLEDAFEAVVKETLNRMKMQ